MSNYCFKPVTSRQHSPLSSLSEVVMTPIILKHHHHSHHRNLFSHAEKVCSFFRHISCELPWDQGWQVKAIKFHWERRNIYLGGHFDSKEIQPPCCQDLRGEHIHFSVTEQEMQNANHSKKKNSTAKTPHKESKSSLQLIQMDRELCWALQTLAS